MKALTSDINLVLKGYRQNFHGWDTSVRDLFLWTCVYNLPSLNSEYSLSCSLYELSSAHALFIISTSHTSGHWHHTKRPEGDPKLLRRHHSGRTPGCPAKVWCHSHHCAFYYIYASRQLFVDCSWVCERVEARGKSFPPFDADDDDITLHVLNLKKHQ